MRHPHSGCKQNGSHPVTTSRCPPLCSRRLSGEREHPPLATRPLRASPPERRAPEARASRGSVSEVDNSFTIRGKGRGNEPVGSSLREVSRPDDQSLYPVCLPDPDLVMTVSIRNPDQFPLL